MMFGAAMSGAIAMLIDAPSASAIAVSAVSACDPMFAATPAWFFNSCTRYMNGCAPAKCEFTFHCCVPSSVKIARGPCGNCPYGVEASPGIFAARKPRPVIGPICPAIVKTLVVLFAFAGTDKVAVVGLVTWMVTKPPGMPVPVMNAPSSSDVKFAVADEIAVDPLVVCPSAAVVCVAFAVYVASYLMSRGVPQLVEAVGSCSLFGALRISFCNAASK